MSGPLSVPAFRRLVVAWSFSNFGDSALFLTIAIWVKDLTDSDAAAGLVFLFLGLPAFIAPLAGHVADRFPRRATIAVANLVAAVGVMSLAFVHSEAQLWLIYLVTFGYGTLSYITAASGAGLVRDLVADEHLGAANGLLSSIDQGLRLVSPLAGAGLYALFGGTAIAVLTASTLVIATVIVLSLRIAETKLTDRDDRAGFLAEVSAGARHIRRTPGLATLTLWLAVATGVTGLANATGFAAIDQGLGRSSEFFAVIGSVQGIGAITGGLTAAHLMRRLGESPTLALGIAALAVGLASMLTTSTEAMLAGAVVVGLGIPWAYVSHATIRQRTTPGALQGRVAAACNLAFNGPQTAMTAVGAGLIAVVDYRLMIVVMLVVLAVAAVRARGVIVPPADGVESNGQASRGSVTCIDGSDPGVAGGEANALVRVLPAEDAGCPPHPRAHGRRAGSAAS